MLALKIREFQTTFLYEATITTYSKHFVCTNGFETLKGTRVQPRTTFI